MSYDDALEEWHKKNPKRIDVWDCPVIEGIAIAISYGSSRFHTETISLTYDEMKEAIKRFTKIMEVKDEVA